MRSHKTYKCPFRQIISFTLIIAFITSSLYLPQAQAGEMVMMRLPVPGLMVHLSPSFIPAHLQGLTIHPENALQFDFLIHKGDGDLDEEQKKVEYAKLVKYFLASLTIPDEDQWVNLSPYEHNRIIKDDFGKTEMGRDLLSQDYLLKQITSSLMYPESGLGKEFWAKVYERAYKEYGTSNVPVNTFNKVWIIPDEAAVYESGNTVYVLRNHLKVMLEEDYLSLEKHSAITVNSPHTVTSKIVKEIIIPELEKEVNEGKNFAMLRQIYSGMILATWYKHALKESLLGKVYANKARVIGVEQKNPQGNEIIYQRYLKAFKKGVFNFIKEDMDQYSQQLIPRKYFAGGVVKGYTKTVPGSPSMTRYPEAVVVYRSWVDVSPAMLGTFDHAAVAKDMDSAVVTLDAPNTRTDAAMLITEQVRYNVPLTIDYVGKPIEVHFSGFNLEILKNPALDFRKYPAYGYEIRYGGRQRELGFNGEFLLGGMTLKTNGNKIILTSQASNSVIGVNYEIGVGTQIKLSKSREIAFDLNDTEAILLGLPNKENRGLKLFKRFNKYYLIDRPGHGMELKENSKTILGRTLDEELMSTPEERANANVIFDWFYEPGSVISRQHLTISLKKGRITLTDGVVNEKFEKRPSAAGTTIEIVNNNAHQQDKRNQRVFFPKRVIKPFSSNAAMINSNAPFLGASAVSTTMSETNPPGESRVYMDQKKGVLVVSDNITQSSSFDAGKFAVEELRNKFERDLGSLKLSSSQEIRHVLEQWVLDVSDQVTTREQKVSLSVVFINHTPEGKKEVIVINVGGNRIYVKKKNGMVEQLGTDDRIDNIKDGEFIFVVSSGVVDSIRQRIGDILLSMDVLRFKKQYDPLRMIYLYVAKLMLEAKTIAQESSRKQELIVAGLESMPSHAMTGYSKQEDEANNKAMITASTLKRYRGQAIKLAKKIAFYYGVNRGKVNENDKITFRRLILADTTAAKEVWEAFIEGLASKNKGYPTPDVVTLYSAILGQMSPGAGEYLDGKFMELYRYANEKPSLAESVGIMKQMIEILYSGHAPKIVRGELTVEQGVPIPNSYFLLTGRETASAANAAMIAPQTMLQRNKKQASELAQKIAVYFPVNQGKVKEEDKKEFWQLVTEDTIGGKEVWEAFIEGLASKNKDYPTPDVVTLYSAILGQMSPGAGEYLDGKFMELYRYANEKPSLAESVGIMKQMIEILYSGHAPKIVRGELIVEQGDRKPDSHFLLTGQEEAGAASAAMTGTIKKAVALGLFAAGLVKGQTPVQIPTQGQQQTQSAKKSAAFLKKDKNGKTVVITEGEKYEYEIDEVPGFLGGNTGKKIKTTVVVVSIVLGNDGMGLRHETATITLKDTSDDKNRKDTLYILGPMLLQFSQPPEGLSKIDNAALAMPFGGIDLNSANLHLQIKRDGRGVPLPLLQQDWAQLSQIQGFIPTIIEITPVTALPILSELQQKLRSS